METSVVIAIIAAVAGLIAPDVSFYLTKRKEREAEWQRSRMRMYEELVLSLSGIVGTDNSPEGARRFAASCNTLHLFASKGVLDALHDFQDCIAVSNVRRNEEHHDVLLSRLLWQIRADLEIPGNPPAQDFNARLWCSGTSRSSATPDS